MIEAVVDAVLHGAIGEQTRKAAPARIDQRGLAADVEETLVLTREARLRQVFRGRGTANGNRYVRALFRDEVLVRCRYFRTQTVGQLGFADQLAAPPRPVHQAIRVVRRNAVEQLVQASCKAVVRDEIPVCRCRHGKTRRYRRLRAAQRPEQFAERCVLAADAADVGVRDVAEPAYVLHVGVRPCPDGSA